LSAWVSVSHLQSNGFGAPSDPRRLLVTRGDSGPKSVMKGSPVRVRASAIKALLSGYFCCLLSRHVKCSGETTPSWEGLLAHIGCTKPVSLRAGGGTGLTSSAHERRSARSLVRQLRRGLPGVYGVVTSGHRAEPNVAQTTRCWRVRRRPGPQPLLTERADIRAAAHPSRYRIRAKRSSAGCPHLGFRSSSGAVASAGTAETGAPLGREKSVRSSALGFS